MSQNGISSNHDAFLHWIDFPVPRRTTSRNVELAGWCLKQSGGPAPQLRVRIRSLLGSQLITTCEWVERSDALATVSSAQVSPRCGFEFRVPLRLGANLLDLEVHRASSWTVLSRAWVWRSPGSASWDNVPRQRFRKGGAWPKDLPLVSVVIACHGQDQHFVEAFDSVLAQTFSRFELIIVHKGYGDHKAVENLSGVRSAFVIHQPDHNLPAAWNAGISRARGKWICCLDSYARLTPTYLEKCVFVLETDDFDICGSLQQNLNSGTEIWAPGPFKLERLIHENCMIGAAVFRKELWKRVGGYDPRMGSGFEDWEFWIRLAKTGARATCIPEPLFLYRAPALLTAIASKEHRKIVSYIRQKHADCFTNPAKVLLVDETQNQQLSPRSYRNLLPTVVSSPSKRPYAILVALPSLEIGGGEARVSRICSHLSRQGFRFVIISTEAPNRNQGDCTPWFESGAAEVFPLPRLAHESRWPDFIDYLIESRPIDLVWQVGSAYMYKQLPHLKQRFPTLKVVDLLFNSIDHTGDFLKYNYLIDHVITEHIGMKEWLLVRGEPDDVVSIIPGGVDLELFQPKPKVSWREKRDLARDHENRFVVGFFGQFSELNGTDVFLEIAARFRDRDDIEFLIAGGEPLEQPIQAAITSWGLKNVHPLGFVDAEEYLPCCDLLVVCSPIDGRPNAIMESQAMGVPVVASRDGGGRWDHLGLLGEVDDLEGFYRDIRCLAENRTRHEEMRRSARRFAEQHFSLDHSVQQYSELFRAVVQRERRPGPQALSANGTV